MATVVSCFGCGRKKITKTKSNYLPFAYLIRLSWFFLGASGPNNYLQAHQALLILLAMTPVEDIVSGMEYQTLTTIKGRPNYEIINTICRKICANAASVDLLQGGAHGHLGQVITPATYLMVTATPYNNPLNPGLQSPRLPALFPQQWDNIKAAHKRNWMSLTPLTTSTKPSNSRSSKRCKTQYSSSQPRITSPDTRE
jgi:hypothetical protein